MGPKARERVLERLREVCLGLPEMTERLSHGAPTFFVRGKRPFVMVLTDHHGDGRFAIWCAAGEGVQRCWSTPTRAVLRPAVRRPPRLARRSARPGPRLRTSSPGIVEDAYAEVAPAKLVEAAARSTADRRVDWSDRTHIRGRHGFDVVGSPAELQAEVSGRPRKTTGTKRKCGKRTSHSLL